jgi:PhoH-like ATPase
MPLPKLPGKPGDILDDYGPEPKPEKAPARPKRAAAKAAAKTAAKAAPAAAKAVKKAAAAAPKSAKRPAKKAAAPAAAKSARKAPAAAAKPAAKARPERGAEKPAAEARAKASASRGRPAALSAGTAAARSDSPNPSRRQSGRRGRAKVRSTGKKLFVLDTNVLLHDPLSLFHFDEHDVFLPMTVLEELDNHKKGTTDVARNARAVARTLDSLIEANGPDLSKGIALSALGNREAQGRLFFETRPFAEALPAELPTFKGDNAILAVVKGAEKAFPDRSVVLVSKDVNMRIKATMLGIPTEDYLTDKVLDDTDMLYSGKLVLPADFWERVAASLKSWQTDGTTHYRFRTEHPSQFILNECLTIEGDPDFMAMVTSVDGNEVTMRLLLDYRTRQKVWGIHARNVEQNMALNLLMDPEIDFVTLLGQAGTGKTLMTLAAALSQTIDDRLFSEIIMTRATVSVGEEIGFLPGTEEEKMAPWMGALEDNLEVLQRSESSAGGDWGRQASLDLIKARIRIKSMSFMRGRTFFKKFLIIDEAQNLSPKQMKTLITRAGPGTKIVCMGNIAQIDTPYLTEGSSGLTYVVERFQGWAHAATITLTRGERSRLADYATEVL